MIYALKLDVSRDEAIYLDLYSCNAIVIVCNYLAIFSIILILIIVIYFCQIKLHLFLIFYII
jgi:hypothetical protein